MGGRGAASENEQATRLSVEKVVASRERLDSRRLDERVVLLAEKNKKVAVWLASVGAGGAPRDATPEWLASPECPWQIANPVLLSSARSAVLAGRCEEGLAWLALREANNARPAEPTPADGEAIALYYRAVASHQLVQLKEAEAAAAALLGLPAAETSVRQRRIAQLILEDVRRTDKDSIGFVAKMMGDSRRRLMLGRSGAAPQRLQQDIVKRLDKLIDALEQEQQKQQEQQQQAGGQSPAGGVKPLEASRPAELKKPGEVDGPRAAASGDWGSLPPAERARVTQQIARDFPGHYRTLIEEYFRSLANPQDENQEPADQPVEAAGR